MLYILLFVSVFTDTFKNIYYNHFSNNILQSNSDAILFNAVCGAGAVNLINLYLSGKLPSIILFPILNGGVIVLSGAAALIIFKEKLSCKQYLGIFWALYRCILGIS